MGVKAPPLAYLRERAEGVFLVMRHKDGSETVFCGHDENGEYLGWMPREDADAKGYNYQADGDDGIAALLKATDLAWAAVAANYDTADGDIVDQQPLWTALADLEVALREVGYVA